MNANLIKLSFLIIAIAIVIAIFIFYPQIFKSKSSNYLEIVKPVDPNFEYKDNVYLLKGNNFSIAENSITLNTLTPELKIGDILIGDESPGFLRGITNIEINKNQRILTTKVVNISEVIKQGNLETAYTIVETEEPVKYQNYNNISSPNFVVFKKYTTKKLSSLSDSDPQKYRITISEKSSTSYNLPFTQTIQLNTISTKITGSLIIYGNLTIIPTIFINLNIGWSGIKNFDFVITFDVKSKLGANLNAICKDLIKNSWTKIFPLGNWVIPICQGVWITISPNISIGFDININGSLKIHNVLDNNTTSPYTIGLSYKEGEKVKSIFQPGEFSRKISPVGSDTNQLTIDIYLNPRINFDMNVLLFGVLGPFISLLLYYKYNQNSVYSLCNGSYTEMCYKNDIKNLLGFVTKIGGQFFDEKISFDLYNKEWLL